MLKTVLRVLRSQRPDSTADARHHDAYRVGMRFWKENYGPGLIQDIKRSGRRHPGRAIRGVMTLVRFAPALAARKLADSMLNRGRDVTGRAARALLPDRMVRRLRTLRVARAEPIPLGRVDLGDLHRLRPVSRVFGFDRGLPIDRYYIEGFLLRHAGDIAGRVLEIADNSYTVRFGGARVVRSDILHVNDDNPLATFVGDLADAPQLPTDAFDCVILTQTLHLIYDMKAAVRTLHRILAPGGVLLLTSPGITQVEHGVRGNEWLWTFTHDSIRRLLDEVFPPADVHVEDHGNVFAAVAFLHGLALEEVSTDALDHHDPAYQVIVAARAMKPHAAS
jgi:SAM-dependent methyltransferase